MNLLNDIYRFIGCLSFVDIIFFVAIIALLILLVTLVYFIRINKEVLGEDDLFPPTNSGKKEKVEEKKDVIEQITAEPSLEVIEEYNDEEGELLDLESLTKKLKAEDENGERITCTEYEKDQEEKAIISYDELLKKHNRYTLNYEKEEIIDDLIVKKVNLNDLVNKNEEEIKVEENIKEEVRVISYQKEEAFLSALKELNSLLN